MTFDPRYVIDTMALIWYLTDDKKLSAKASTLFEAAEQGTIQLVIPAIVIAELYYADKKWKLFDDFNQVYREMRAKPYYQFIPFEADHVLDFARDERVPEMHDRIVVGVAKRLGIHLVTSDPAIHKAKAVDVIW